MYSISCDSISYPWLVFFFGAQLRGSMIRKHTRRWMWQESASDVFWKWEKNSCHSKLVWTLSMLLLSVLSWRVSEVGLIISYNCMSPGAWSLWLSQTFVHSLWILYWCYWCCLSWAWSSRHWSPCRRLRRLCRDAQLILPVLLPLLLSHQCHQQSRACLQRLTVPSWSSKASVLILSRNMLKRVGESRHPCRTPAVVRDHFPMLLLNSTALVALSQRFLMTWIRFEPMLYFFIVANCCTVKQTWPRLHVSYFDFHWHAGTALPSPPSSFCIPVCLRVYLVCLSMPPSFRPPPPPHCFLAMRTWTKRLGFYHSVA